jgi:hypothetical protein
MLSWLSDRSITRDMIISTCCSHAAVTFRQKSHTTHDNTTAFDQHVNVIMCRVRLLSESHGSMWPTCWYYHVSCTTSVGKSRQHVTNILSDRSRTRDMITLTCWSYAVVTFRQKSYTRDMITLTCWSQAVVTFRQKSYTRHDNIDFCPKVMTACDQHVDITMSRVRLLSENHDSMWPTC